MKVTRKISGGKIAKRIRNIIKKKPVHIAVDYPCNHCGMVETWCGTEVFGIDEWTDDPEKSTCKDCIREY